MDEILRFLGCEIVGSEAKAAAVALVRCCIILAIWKEGGDFVSLGAFILYELDPLFWGVFQSW